MATCPKCQSNMRIDGIDMVCTCGYRYEVPRRLPSLPEAMKIIKQKDEEIAEKDAQIAELEELLKWKEEWNRTITNFRD